jgi:hypothetical protein
MAIKLSGSPIIDDGRNIVNAGVGTFTGGLSVGIGSSVPGDNTVQVNANVELLGITTVGQDLVVSGGSTFTGVSTFADAVYIGSGLTVTSGGLDVTGITSLGGDLNVTGSISNNSAIISTGAISGSSLSIPGNSTLGVANVTTLTAGNVTFDSFSLLGSGTTSFTATTQTSDSVGVGTTVILLKSLSSAQVNDFVSIGTFFNKRRVVGIITSTPVSPYDENLFTRSLSYDIGVGSTIIFLNSNSNISVGNSISITGISSYIAIVGLATTAVGIVNVDNVFPSISGDVSAGSTIVGLSTLTGIAIGHSFSDSGTREYLEIVGFGTTTVAAYNVLTLTDSVYEELAANAEFIPISLETPSGISTLVSVGNSITINDGFSNVVTNARIIALGTTSVTPYTEALVNTTVSDSVGTGVSIIPVNSTSQVTANLNRVTITSEVGSTTYVGDILIVGVGTTSVTPSTQELFATSTSENISTGSTIIFTSPTTGVEPGDRVTVRNTTDTFITYINEVDIVSVGTTFVTVDAENAPLEDIIAGEEVQFLEIITSSPSITLDVNTSSNVPSNARVAISTIISARDAVQISPGAGYTDVLPSGSTVSISTVRTDSVAVVLDTGVGFGLTVGNTAIISYPTFPVSEAVLIGAGDTQASVISAGVAATVSKLVTETEAVTISVATTEAVPTFTDVLIERVDEDDSVINALTVNSTNLDVTSAEIDNINVIGIATINGVTYPTLDGLKGQVLVTDGEGNLGFGTGGGSGGSEVILSVSANTGSDDNDGKILPLRTIKKATQLASKVGRPVTIQVETGEYVEDNPIIVYDDVSIIGDSLRNIVVRPLNGEKDLFKVRNGCYLTGMSFNDNISSDGVPQFTYDYAVAFDNPFNPLVDRTGYAATSTLTITDVKFNHLTGITSITTSEPHELYKGNTVRLAGIAFTCGYDEVGISTFVYDETTGISTVTFFSDALLGESGSGYSQKGYKIGDQIFLNNLPFSCSEEHVGVTTTIFPDGTSEYGKVFTITGINTASKTLVFNAGISTIPHVYEGYPSVNISAFSYDETTGIATATTASAHGFTAGQKITLEGLEFSCAAEHAGITTTKFPDGTITDYTSDGYTFTVGTVLDSTSFSYNVGVSTIAHTYVSGGSVRKVPTIQEVWTYPEKNSDGRVDFGVVSVASSTEFTVRAATISSIPHYYVQGGTADLSKPLINKSPYIQNCSILSSLGGNGILVDGNLVTEPNFGLIPELGEIPVVGDQPVFGKSMVAATFTMVSFGGIGWRTVNDGYAQVVSCFQIFCGTASLCQSGGYLSITNSATNFGNYSLRSTGFSPKSFAFDRSRVVATGTQGGLQTLRVVGLGRSDQELYVLRFFDDTNSDKTSDFKPLVQSQEFTGTDINPATDIFTIPAHPFINGDSVVYFGNEGQIPRQSIDGLISGNLYYVQYIDSSNFRLFEDDGLQTAVSIASTFVGINTFQKNNQEFFVKELTDAHQSYQTVSLASTTSSLVFNPGQVVTQSATGASGYAITFNNTNRELLLSVEASGGVRPLFTNAGPINDHSGSPVSIGVTNAVNTSGYYTIEFTLDSTVSGNTITGIASLPQNYKCHFHRPSIVNSSSHTWEYSGSGTDYNALPENGGKSRDGTEQVAELGGRVYASGTNELGDFKIGDQITAFNRTGNIIFNNKVSIGQLDSIRLSLSGGVAVEEFSTDVNLGEAEVGGPSDTRVSTQLAVRSFLNNRLGTFIDKAVSTNAVPNAVVQLNSAGQINADLIPPKVVQFNRTNVDEGRFYLSNQIPAVDIAQGDTVVEPSDSYVLINDVVSQYLVLDNGGSETYTFDNGDTAVSALNAAAIGIVTAPPTGLVVGAGDSSEFSYVGYGTTGLVKGVLTGLTLTSTGTGYDTVGVYTGVYLNASTGIGASAVATITVGAAGSVTTVSLVGGGKGYAVGDVLTVSDPNDIGGRTGGSNFSATVSSAETRLYLSLTNNQKFAGSSVLSDYIADDNAVAISTSLTTSYTESFTPTSTGVGGAVDFDNDRIVVGANSFVDGDAVIYDANGGNPLVAGGLGIFDEGTYYTKVVGAGTSVELYRGYNLTDKVDLTGSGTGTHVLRRNVVNVSNDTLHVVNHGFPTGTAVRATGDTPTGITTAAFYYLGSVRSNSFTLHNTQADALFSVNGVTFNAVAIAATHTGTLTLTEQNVQYSDTVNTSGSDENNWTILATGTVSAENIVSGIIAPTRLGSGTANSDTFLNGVSQYEKVVKSVGIGTTEPVTVIASSADYAPGGVGINSYYGKVDIRLNRVESSLDLYSTTGVARFRTSTFSIAEDGGVSVKTGSTGDIDAALLQGQGPAYYLNSTNHTGAVPVTRGGTGLTGAPSNGALLVGNGSGFNLTTAPILQGTVIAPSIYWGTNASRTETKDNAGTIASKSGFFETASPTNYYTGATGSVHLIEARGSNDSDNYALQIAGSFTDQNLYFRKTNNSSTTAWTRIIGENSSGITTVGNIGVHTAAVPSGTALAVNGTISEVYNGQFWNVVTQADVGYGASQVPLNQHLGQLAFLDDYAPSSLRRENGGSDDLLVDANGNIGIGTTVANYRLQVVGSFAATTKSFLIDHPTKEGMQLRYGSLEGPENGVYVRGRCQEATIVLPDYWTGLVDEDSITVNLTPIGDSATPRVKSVLNNTVMVFTKEEGDLDYYFTVFAERKDVDKLEVEF